MSLDVYLNAPGSVICKHCGGENIVNTEKCVYTANITHNLNLMAMEADIYTVLWRPDENGITTAQQLIAPLQAGLAKMIANPTHYKQFDASNKWGSYAQFISWIEAYLTACIAHPDAFVEVSR
jgi:hypothetical protein